MYIGVDFLNRTLKNNFTSTLLSFRLQTPCQLLVACATPEYLAVGPEF
jgi:hypothetical protein